MRPSSQRTTVGAVQSTRADRGAGNGAGPARATW